MNISLQKLQKNFHLMFWIQALLNFKIINIVSTLFYIHRGLNLQEVFFTVIVFSVINLLFEIPSSYIADRWGRKKTIILATVFASLSSLVYFFSHNFWFVALAIAFYALSYACMSGTDDALIYDTSKELGLKNDSLKKIGKYYSSQRIFKIVTPIIGAIIAQNLLEWQFMILIGMDFLASIVAMFISFCLKEPNHYQDLSKIEIGLIKSGFNLILKDKILIKAILSRTLLFISSFIIWRLYQDFFFQIGIPIIVIGLATAFYQLLLFIFSQNINWFLSKKTLNKVINQFNSVFTVSNSLFLICAIFYPQPYLLLGLFIINAVAEGARWPLYSQFFNQHFHSYNRATVLSLSNFMKSIFDLPIMFLASILIQINIVYVFGLSVLIAVLVTISCILPREKVLLEN